MTICHGIERRTLYSLFFFFAARVPGDPGRNRSVLKQVVEKVSKRTAALRKDMLDWCLPEHFEIFFDARIKPFAAFPTA